MTSAFSQNNNQNQFQAYSIKYENITNRLQRLKHTQNQSTVVRSSSLANIQPKTITKNYSNSRIPLGHNILLTNDQSALDISSKYAGRVTKNTGIKKYNQRQIRQILNNRRLSPQKIHQEEGVLRQQKAIRLMERASEQRAKNNNQNQSSQIQTFGDSITGKLVPGKIYTREQLQKYYS